MNQKLKQLFCRHPHLTDMKEIHATAEDLVAETGTVHLQGLCTNCGKTIYWKESNV